MNKDLLRLIDASFNRSREGLRVCEDIARFLLDSGPLTRQFKDIRHSVTAIVGGMPGKAAGKAVRLSDFRDVIRDVGRCSKKKSEMTRIDCRDIFAANTERVKESLRVLEEFFKLIDRDRSKALSRLRFRMYDIEKGSAKKIAALSGIKCVLKG